ncbi:LysR family transcriptional regulator [Acidovorax sp. SUPP1855]|uniref:LysR family transcriptional regulator n=1 Tax=Acidovorax sp. SUPP1855 TaxID=431774 RepID=UPI0023DE42D8|nr:LysR family transcriptional regulator [Acidovorax sp. SUPP1855]GKS85414.1 LysR family transcriptional regulator [Acidovorax sp. SUPP1855]
MRAHLLQDTALRYFLEVAQCGSLTEASARLHVAASALSRQIAGLEAQLGTPLFERHPRGMVLTAAGEILATHARRTGLDAERALGEIGALLGLRAGQVRLATSDVFANELVPRLCVAFQREHPGIRFTVTALPTAQVPEAVRTGVADIGLCFSRAPQPGIQVAHRQSAPVLAMLPPGHPLAGASRISLAQMARFPLVLPPQETIVRQMIDMACSRQGLQLEPVLVSNHARTVLEFVAHGGGVSVSSEIATRHAVAAGAIVARPLGDPGMDLRDIEVQTLAGRALPVAAQAFLERLKAQLTAP